MGWTSTTTYEPAWGSETSVVDFNGRRTDLSYDGLGRLTAVWLPGRDKAREQSASLVHTYLVRNSGGPTATATGKLNADGSGYLTTWTLYDGQLRPRQTQTPASGGGRLITDTQYDSRGFAAQANQSYFNNAAPDGNLFVPAGPVAGRTLTTYDSAGRKAQESFQVYGVERWHTSYYDGGDHTDLTVPLGATATSTWTDGRGHEVAVRQYHGNVPTGPYDTTTKRYTQTDQLGGVTDAAGNKWTYTYDQLGRKKTEDDPDKGHSSYTYDNAEELLTATDARQTTLAYDYDPMGRKTGLFEDPRRVPSSPRGPTTR